MMDGQVQTLEPGWSSVPAEARIAVPSRAANP